MYSLPFYLGGKETAPSWWFRRIPGGLVPGCRAPSSDSPNSQADGWRDEGGWGPHPTARPQPILSLCPQLTREFFTKELTKHYQGNNDTDVFSATWNSVMITVSDPPKRL